MDTKKDFEVLVRHKFPYLSSGLMYIMIALFVVLFLFYIVMYPTKYSSEEMATVYFILVVPNWLKTISALAFIGLIITFPLYNVTRLQRSALLTISSDNILIKGDTVDITIKSRFITKIYISDLTDLLGRPKNKMQIVIRHRKKMITVLKLKNYNESEEVFDALSKIDNTEFIFFDKSISTMHNEEI
jgi:hypothetical protein